MTTPAYTRAPLESIYALYCSEMATPRSPYDAVTIAATSTDPLSDVQYYLSNTTAPRDNDMLHHVDARPLNE